MTFLLKKTTATILVIALQLQFVPVVMGGVPTAKGNPPVTKSDIVIVGTVDCSDGHLSESCGWGNGGWGGGGGYDGGGDSGGGASDAHGGGVSNASNGSSKTNDVRCNGDGLYSRVTSASSLSEKVAAANALWDISKVTGGRNNREYSLIMADGGVITFNFGDRRDPNYQFNNGDFKSEQKQSGRVISVNC